MLGRYLAALKNSFLLLGKVTNDDDDVSGDRQISQFEEDAKINE